MLRQIDRQIERESEAVVNAWTLRRSSSEGNALFVLLVPKVLPCCHVWHPCFGPSITDRRVRRDTVVTAEQYPLPHVCPRHQGFAWLVGFFVWLFVFFCGLKRTILSKGKMNYNFLSTVFGYKPLCLYA